MLPWQAETFSILGFSNSGHDSEERSGVVLLFNKVSLIYEYPQKWRPRQTWNKAHELLLLPP